MSSRQALQESTVPLSSPTTTDWGSASERQGSSGRSQETSFSNVTTDSLPEHNKVSFPSSEATSESFVQPESGLLSRRFVRRLDEDAVRERQELLQEREGLVDRLLDGRITEVEKSRLAFIRWQIERIDDIELQPQLEELETIVEQHERFAEEVGSLLGRLHEVHRGR